jgi:hypothetical protein
MNHNKIDFGRLGFTDYQVQDLRIILSLNTPELMQEWAVAVGSDDAMYGVSLVECAALAMLDQDIENMTAYSEAMDVIRRVQGQ